jgi:hypothetical protein
MTAKSAILQLPLRVASIAACVASSFAVAQAPSSTTPMLPPVNVRLSSSSAGYGSNKVLFSTAKRLFTCPDSGISAIVTSSPSGGTGKVLVDNAIFLTVTHGNEAPNGPINICKGGVIENGGRLPDCFTTAYQIPASEGKLTGVDPDTLVATGGVGPLDISSYLAPGLNQIKLDLADTGGYLASSSINLYTNCTANGVTGPTQISGNPISSTNPAPSSLTQTFSFNKTNKQIVQQTYDLSVAEGKKTLTIANGTIPTVADKPIDPAKWPAFVSGTSFATSQCMVHSGESLLNGKPACKLYTVTCQVGQGSTGSGAQCPVSTIRNEVFTDNFDGPALMLPDIVSGKYTFHQGVGYLMASEGWTGGSCEFDSASGLENDFCPLNLLTQFSGVGAYGSKGTSTHPNSAFISVAPVPEDLTMVTLNPPGPWINKHTFTANFVSVPPVVPQPNNDFVAAPIASITYGVSPQDDVPSTEFPVPGDTVLDNKPCPAPGDSGKVTAAKFQPPAQEITIPEDGKYYLRYFATDCAGTEELLFFKDSNADWHTLFFAVPVVIDTVSPEVAKEPVLSPPPTLIHGVLGYAVGQSVMAKYRCSDNLSGVVLCGTMHYAKPVTDPPTVSSRVNTSTAGSKTFTVDVKDLAGNAGTPRSVSYMVVTP